MAIWLLNPVAQIDVDFLLQLLYRAAIIAFILITTWIATKIVGSLISRILVKLRPRLSTQIKSITTLMIWLTGILIVLNQIGLELVVLLLIMAIGGSVIIIALRDVLPSIVSYNIITIYEPFKIGDWIQVDGCLGRVVNLTWMNTVLLTRDNERVYMPNLKIVRDVVLNRTVQGGTRISVPLTVDRSLDLSEVERILSEVHAELSDELIPDYKPEILVNDVDGKNVKVELLLKIANPARDAFISSEVIKRAIKKLDEAKGRIS